MAKADDYQLDKKSAINNETHYLLEIREPGSALVELRHQLQLVWNSDIAKYAARGSSFEACLGILASHLDIAVDGMYDADDLCDLLASALKNRFTVRSTQPHLRDSRLMNVELVEREGDITVEVVDNELDVGVVAPSSPVPATVIATEADEPFPLDRDIGNHCHTCRGTGMYFNELLSELRPCVDCNGNGFVALVEIEEKEGE